MSEAACEQVASVPSRGWFIRCVDEIEIVTGDTAIQARDGLLHQIPITDTRYQVCWIYNALNRAVSMQCLMLEHPPTEPQPPSSNSK